MFKDTISYEDFDGNTVTETLYFNFTKPELLKMQSSVPGGYEKKLQGILDELSKENKDDVDLSGYIDFYEMFISEAYGVKSEDGKRFVKSKEAKEAFMQSNAYSTIFMKLVTDEDYIEKFSMGVIPSDLAAEIANNDSSQIVSQN